MTDPQRSVGRETTITVAADVTCAGAVRDALGPHPLPEGVVILPSSLRRTDRLAGAVREVLRNERVASRLLVPANPVAALLPRLPRTPARSWIDFEIHPPDMPPVTISLPDPLYGGSPVWSVTDVDAVAGTGPYILDLVARYLHPLGRLRQLGSRGRTGAVADLNLAARPSTCVIGKMLGSVFVAGIATDPIAAELFALALADEDLPPDRSVTGPWEDRVVQRATELELGIQIPQQLSIDLVGEPGEAVRTALERVAARIGVTIA